MGRLTAFVLLLVTVLTGCALGPDYDSIPQMPVNISPADKSDIIINTPTTFVWQATADTEYYQFHIYNNETKDILQYQNLDIRPNSVCEAGRCSMTLTIALPYKENHAWRVRAANYYGFSTYNRTLFNMVGSGFGAGGNTTGDATPLMAPSIPSPISPDSNNVQAKSMVEFVWKPTADATGYDFHIYDGVNSEIVDALDDLPATTVCQGDDLCRLIRAVRLSPSDAHAWRIRAVNQNGRSDWTRKEFNVIR